MNIDPATHSAGNAAAIIMTIASLFQFLPWVAALFAILWYSVNIYEKVTGRPFSESWFARMLRGFR
jgi:hypothetical protein